MLIVHKSETENSVSLPKKEFEELIRNYKKYEPIEIVDDKNSNNLSSNEQKAKKEALKELENGETITLKEWKKQLRKREKMELI